MATAENFFQTAKESGKQGVIKLKNRAIPFKWLSHPIITPLGEKLAPQVLKDVPNTLNYSHIPDAVSTLLSQEQGLTATV